MAQSCRHLCQRRASKPIPTLPAALCSLWSLWSQVRCQVLLWFLQQDGWVPRSFSRNSCCNYFWNFVPQGFPEQIAPLLRNFSWFLQCPQKTPKLLSMTQRPTALLRPLPSPSFHFPHLSIGLLVHPVTCISECFQRAFLILTCWNSVLKGPVHRKCWNVSDEWVLPGVLLALQG